MRYPLCVLTPEVGVLSETFIEWDINQLLPGKTVVVADPPPLGETVLRAPSWTTDAPALRFDPLPGDPLPTSERRAQLARFLRDHGVEVVLVQFLDFAQRWFDVLIDAGVRVWLRGHGADLSVRLDSSYVRFAAATGITVPSKAAADRLLSVGLPAGLVHVVPNHVEVTQRPLARTLGDVVRCVSVGRLVPKKGHRYLIDAFEQAVTDEPRLRLDIIGDGPLRVKLQQQIGAADLTQQVRLIGAIRPGEVVQRLAKSDVFMHHAVTAKDGDVEGQPLAVLQAMAAALPCLVTRHEGIPELIKHGTNGFLVAERDTSATARGLVQLATDGGLRRRLGISAWNAIRAGHTHEHARSTLLRLLRLQSGRR